MIIAVREIEESFFYDVHSLLRAFFPNAQVQTAQPENEARVQTARPENEAQADLYVLAEVREDAVRIRIGDGPLRETACPKDLPRADRKSLLKQMLYRELVSCSGRELPWGTLTGIRPVKIALTGLLRGQSREEIARRYREFYLTGEAKTALSLAVAERELRILNGEETLSSGAAVSGIDAVRGGYSLYVSVPFCPSICAYCSFPSGTVERYRAILPAYLSALQTELDAIADCMKGRKLYSVYVGGGTPTSLPDELFRELLCGIAERFDAAGCPEYTIEAGRPDTVTREKLSAMREAGVTRISINPQTMHDKTLRRIGRAHTAEQVEAAFLLAREAGFDDINMDLIRGLPGEDDAMFQESMKRIESLGPEALTVHSLALKRSSALYEEARNAEDPERGESRENAPAPADAMAAVIDAAGEAGLMPYYLYRQKNIAGNLENIGFAREGKAGLYNILMMEELQTVMAAGAGSITRVVREGDGKAVRAANVSDIPAYLSRIDEMILRKTAALTEAR